MTGWLARAERLCYEGEEITEVIRLGEGGVAVTTHRVMAFSPHADGENFADADRPNVEGVERDEGGDAVWLQRGAKALVVGAIVVVAGAVVDMEAIVGDVSLTGAGRVGFGGVLEIIQGVLGFLAMLDDLLLLVGGIALLAAAASLGVYLQSRETTLRVAVAGGEDLTVPVEEWPAADVVGRLERAIAPAGGGAVPGPAATEGTISPADG